MKKTIILAAVAVAFSSLMPLGTALAGDHRHGRGHGHHHHHYYHGHGYDRGRYYPPYYYRPPPPPPPAYYYYYAPPPRPPAAIIYRDYGYGSSLNFELQLRDRR